jgi:hypothetical protein
VIGVGVLLNEENYAEMITEAAHSLRNPLISRTA